MFVRAFLLSFIGRYGQFFLLSATSLLLLVGIFGLSHNASAAVVDATWNTDAVGDWSDTTNWDTDPVFPDNGVDTYNVFLYSGQTTLDGIFTIGDLTLDGGELVGTGELNVDGTFYWIGGALPENTSAIGSDGSISTININGDAFLAGAFKQFAAATVNFAGNTTWVGGNINAVDPPEGGVFNNSGTFDIQGDVLWSWNVTGSPTFNNEAGGLIKRTVGTGFVEMWAAFNNDGDVEVETGTLQLANGGTSSGTFTVDSGATLWFSDFSEGFSGAGAPITELTVDSVMTSSGTVRFGNLFGNATTNINGTIDSDVVVSDPGEFGVVTFGADSFYGATTPGTFEAVSGTTNFESPETHMSDLTVQDGATVNATEDLDVSGDVSVFGSGAINLDGSEMNFSTTGTKVITGDGEVVLTSAASITTAGRVLIDTDVTIRGSGSIRGAAVSAVNGFNEGTIESDAGGTLFIDDLDNAGTISVSDGTTLDYEDQSNSFFTNLGTIEVSGGGQLVTRNLANQNQVSIDGGTLDLVGENFTNAGGTITGNNATIQFRLMTFTFADVGTIVRTNSELALAEFSELNNTGQTLNLNNSTGQQGTWTMRGGKITGGTIQSSGGATLLFPATRFGTLDGVTLNTGPTMGSGSSMFVHNSLTLNNITVDLSNGGTGSANMTFVLGTRLLSGTGTVVLGNDSSRGVSGDTFGGGNVTIGSGILIRGQRGFVNRATNQGKVSADVSGGIVAFRDSINDVGGVLEAKNGGILRLENNWDNNGLIDVQTSSTLWMTGNNVTADIGTIQRAANTTVRLSDTLTNTGEVLDVQAKFGGDVELSQAIIVGGTISSSGAGRLLVDNNINGSQFNGVTLSADVGFTAAAQVSTGILTIINGLTLDGSTIDAQNNIGLEFSFSGTSSQTLGGTGEIIVRGNGGSTNIRNNSTNGAVATFGPDVTMRVGAASLFQSVTVDGKSNNLAGGFVNQGTLIFENGQQNMVDLRNEGTIHVEAGTPDSVLQLFNSQNETVFVQTGGEFIVSDLVRARVGMEIRGGEITGTGGVVHFPDTPKELVVETGGTIAVGGGNTLVVDGNVVIGDGGRFEATLSGSTETGSLLISLSQFQTATGTIDLTSANNFLDIVNLGGIVPGQNYSIAQTPGQILGQFESVTPGYEVVYQLNQIFVKAISLVDGDYDNDGDVDGRDFLAWQRGESPDPFSPTDLALWQAEYNGGLLSALRLPPSALNVAVPEPGAVVLALAGLLVCLRRRGKL